MSKYHIEKNTVQETLIIPLYGRKVCSEKFPHLFSDPEAERICDGLDYDFSEKGRKMESGVGLFGALEVAQRQYDIACEVRDFLKARPAPPLSTWAAGWMTPFANAILASAGAATTTCRMSSEFATRFCRPVSGRKTLPLI